MRKRDANESGAAGRPRGGLWEMELAALSGFRRRLVVAGRVLHLVWVGFRRDECALRASALTYYTLISLFPLLALGLALARVFGGESIARERVQRSLEQWAAGASAGAPDAAFQGFVQNLHLFVDRAFDRLAAIHFGTLGGIGLVLLLWAAVEMLGQVESSFNRIWGVPDRAPWRRFSDYVTVLLVVPFLVLAATTVPANAWVHRHMGAPAESFGALLAMPPVRAFATLALLTLLFGFVFRFVPNTRVRLGPVLLGGLFTALVFDVWLRVCAALQIGVVSYGRLYGGFAAVPILLAWTYVSWQIVLLGAELTFAVQNVRTYRLEQDARQASPRARLLLALGAVAAIARAMRGPAGRPWDAAAFAAERRLSLRLLRDVLDDLSAAGIVAGVAGASGCYVLARDPAAMTARDVLAAVLDRGQPPERLGLLHLDAVAGTWAGEAAAAAAGPLDRTVAGISGGATDPASRAGSVAAPSGAAGGHPA
jgi:membrane protein